MYPELEIVAKPAAKSAARIVCVDKKKNVLLSDVPPAVSAAAGRPLVKGESGEAFPFFDADGQGWVLLGLGDPATLTPDALRKSGAALFKTLDRMQAATAVLLTSADAVGQLGAERFGSVLGEGLRLASANLESGVQKSKPAIPAIQIGAADADVARGLVAGDALAKDVNFARWLAVQPPNVATTDFIEEQARILADHTGLKLKVYKGAELAKQNLTGLEAVGRASQYGARLIELVYTPKKKPTATVLLVGKTLCYDTGGLSIKPREGMRGMKYDKCGGTAVLAAMQSVARLKPACRVVALLPTAENSISADAFRVDDVLQYPSPWPSVEVTNTDAEGRLVLADGLIFGQKHHKPDCIIDLATLTGGVVVGLGRACAGYFCEDAGLRAKLEEAAGESGERLWRLPLYPEHREMMKAKHADIWNSAPSRDAHPIQGAAFLSFFVDPKTPWAHIDIAGSANVEKEHPPFVVGPTGYGVRLLAHLLKKF